MTGLSGAAGYSKTEADTTEGPFERASEAIREDSGGDAGRVVGRPIKISSAEG